MDIEQIKNRLEKVKPNGHNKWLARCSCHDDNNPSLSISIADNGKLLLHCFAGCDYSDIARSLGIDSKDYLNENQLTDNEKRAIKEQREKERAEYQQKRLELARYIWKQSKPLTDAQSHAYLIKKQISGSYGLQLNEYQGELNLIIPLGKNGKLTAIQCIDTQGNKKIIGEKSGSYFIRNKQENPFFIGIAEGFATIASIAEDDFIRQYNGFMCVMGIDADNLPKVAQAMRERYPESEIIIFGDMGDDKQKGEKMARKAALLIRGYVAFPPIAKGDFNDYLTSGNVTQSLESLIKEAVQKPCIDETIVNDTQTPAPDPQCDTQTNDTKTTTEPVLDDLIFLDGDDMANNAKAPDFLIDDILETNAHGVIFAPSQSFKSFGVLGMAHSICTGKPFMNHEVFITGKVFYICGEGKNALERRLKAIRQTQGGFNSNFKYLANVVSLDNASDMQRIKTAIEKFKPVLVICDTFSSLTSKTDDNKNDEVAQVLRLIKESCQNGVTSSIVVHHTGKDTQKGERGASAFRNNSDFSFEIKRQADSMITTLSCAKMKDGEPFSPILMKAEIIPLGIYRQNGKEATSLVLMPCDDSETIKESKPLSLRNQEVLSELYKAIDQHGKPATDDIKALFTDEPQNAPAKVVHLEKWREFAYKVIDSETTKLKNQTFNRAKNDLKVLCKIGFYDGFVWAVKYPQTSSNILI